MRIEKIWIEGLRQQVRKSGFLCLALLVDEYDP